MRSHKVFNSTTAPTFHDATQEIRDALAHPAMREKVARVRAEMALEDERSMRDALDRLTKATVDDLERGHVPSVDGLDH